MRIAFALPCSGRYPIGGFRIVYEYANRLAQRGHDLTLLHATDMAFTGAPVPQKFLSSLRLARNRLTGLYRPTTWFELDPNIKTRCSMTLDFKDADRFDVVVATAWQTAARVARLRDCRKYYFIQHFEDWNADARLVLNSWKLPLTKIVISSWLKALVGDAGEHCFVVPNAIDATFFSSNIGMETRPASILVQLHSKDWKGTREALAAVKILRQQGRRFQLELFGLAAPSAFEIEGPYSFHANPSQALLRDLYSRNSIFIAASWAEGWGLTPHEACACGAAVAATDIGGHREFLQPEVSGLLSPPKDPIALARNVDRLLCQDELRKCIAQAGQASARRFSWDHSVPMLEAILRDRPSSDHQAARRSVSNDIC